jgi:hypothetical protein
MATWPLSAAGPGPLTSFSMPSRAALSSPRSTWPAKGPSKNRSQKRSRVRVSGRVAATAVRKLPAKRARRPRRAGSSRSMASRRRRARIGAVPPVEMPISTGSRSTTAGMMKVQSSGRSTTLTGMPAAWAARDTRRSTASRFVALCTTACPATSSARNGRRRRATVPAAASASISSSISGATTVTLAPAFSRRLSLRAAVCPPPTSRQGRPSSARNAG